MQERIRAAGGTFVAISPQTSEKSRELIEARGLTFPLLRDEANVYASQYNVLNRLPADLKELYLGLGIDLAESNGEQSGTLPVPGSYVIDHIGIFRYAAADADYTRRPEPDEAVVALESLP